jgi:C1A family cysteine protease
MEDVTNELPTKFKDELADDIDLREYDNGIILDQFGGTCTAHGIISLLEILNCKLEGNCGSKWKLSERHSWEMDQNYQCKTKVRSHLDNYVALNSDWPHSFTKPTVSNIDKRGVVKLENGWYFGNNHTNLLKALNKGLPLYFGGSTPSSMLSCRPNVSMSAPYQGAGHAFSILGYYHYPEETDLEYILILKQSWGEDCGDHGFQYMPLALCSRDDYYCMFWTFDKIKVK